MINFDALYAPFLPFSLFFYSKLVSMLTGLYRKYAALFISSPFQAFSNNHVFESDGETEVYRGFVWCSSTK